MEHSEKELIDAATSVRENAYAPFSKFRVGAAIETDDGQIIAGCNVESASYGLTVCAERVAIWKAISEGKRKIKHVAVVTDTEELTPPCGACRQVLAEFAGDLEVRSVNLQGEEYSANLRELLPRAKAGILDQPRST